MTLPSSGALSLQSIQGEFGGSNPIGLNEYYRGGSLVANNSNTASIPTSGTIQVDDFYGTSSATPLDLTHNINMRSLQQGQGKTLSNLHGYITSNITSGTPSASDLSISAGGFNATITESYKIQGANNIYASWVLTFNIGGIAQYLFNNYSGATFQGLGFYNWNNSSNTASPFTFTAPTSSTTSLVWGGLTRTNSNTIATAFSNWASGRVNQNTSIVIS